MPRGLSWFTSSEIPPIAAIFIREDASRAWRSLHARRKGFVVIQNGRNFIYSYYISPNSGLIAFGQFLDELGDMISSCMGSAIVAGDFNDPVPGPR